MLRLNLQVKYNAVISVNAAMVVFSVGKRQFASPAVVGGVIGNIVLLVLVMVIMTFVICKRKRK